MNWITKIEHGDGSITFCPPQPKDINLIPRCSYCGGLTQFLHFWVDVLKFIKDDEKVPSFCGAMCAKAFITERVSRIKEAEQL